MRPSEKEETGLASGGASMAALATLKARNETATGSLATSAERPDGVTRA